MNKVSGALNRLSEWALVVFLSAMTLAVFLEILFRYVFHFPLFWTEEFARYCLVWSSLLGATIAFKRGEHIAVTFFMDRLPTRSRRLEAGQAKGKLGRTYQIALQKPCSRTGFFIEKGLNLAVDLYFILR